jgi:hypothetical protein
MFYCGSGSGSTIFSTVFNKQKYFVQNLGFLMQQQQALFPRKLASHLDF